ncbi:hypothetical protein ACFLYB_01365 [Chloroflexota bacterium]
MYTKIVIFKYIYTLKNIPRQLSKCILRYVILASLLLVGLSGVIACDKAELSVPQFIPPSYLDCIELTPLMLGDYYFNYRPLYVWFPTADEILTDKAIIMNDIEITEEMLVTRTESSFKVADNVIVKPRNSSQVKDLKPGDMVDILGISSGISDELSAVVLEECFIEPPGVINLPLEGDGSDGLFDY